MKYITKLKTMAILVLSINDWKKKINAKDLGKVLGGEGDNVDENVWQELIDEADIDKDGEINYEDFKGIMEQC